VITNKIGELTLPLFLPTLRVENTNSVTPITSIYNIYNIFFLLLYFEVKIDINDRSIDYQQLKLNKTT
jgi:hypothetical protein